MICPDCDTEVECRNCKDPRPRADLVLTGWELLTPLGRWERVIRVDRPSDYGRIQIWTELTEGHPWRYSASAKVDATPPRRTPTGTAIVRVIEGEWRNGPIYAVACLDADIYAMPTGPGLIATGSKSTGPGWDVVVQLGSVVARTHHESKSQARTAVRAAARRAARQFHVRLVLTAPAENR